MYCWSYYPKIDLHGEYAVTAYTVVHNFISDHIKLKDSYVVIIHGKGTGKLKDEVHHILSQDRRVLEYHLDPYNLGQTIVHLDISKWIFLSKFDKCVDIWYILIPIGKNIKNQVVRHKFDIFSVLCYN